MGRDNWLILIREGGKGGGLLCRALFFSAACERSPKPLRRFALHACLFESIQLCRVCMGGKWWIEERILEMAMRMWRRAAEKRRGI